MADYKKFLFEPSFGTATLNQFGQTQSQNLPSSARAFTFASNQSQGSTGQNEKIPDLAAYLDRDFQRTTYSQEDIEFRTELLKNEMKNLRNLLPAYGYPNLGDLFSTNLSDIEMTIRCITALVQQRQKDLDYRAEMMDRLNNNDKEKAAMAQSIERLTNQKRNLEAERDSLLAKAKLFDKTLREEREKLNAEKDELAKALIKLQSRETQYQHELRNKDNNYKRLQDQIKRIADKNINFKNSFEMTTTLESKGPVLFSGNSDNEFTFMITKGYEEIHNRLLGENEILRQNLATVQKELVDLMNLKKELFFKRRRIEYGDDMKDEIDFSDTNLFNVKTDLFKMPMEPMTKEAVECLQENIKRFRDFMQRVDRIDQDIEIDFGAENSSEIEKIKCVKNLKLLLKNYKFVVETQDSLLNKTLIQQNKVKSPEELNFTGTRFKIIDDKEMDRVKQFLAEQKSFLEDKQRELAISKQVMGATVKKIDEEKCIISQKRQEIEEETDKFRRALQDIANRNNPFSINEQQETPNARKRDLSQGIDIEN